MRVVERDGVLQTLDAALEDAVAGSGSAVFVAGEAGIGKTTLVRSFVARHGEVPALVGACDDLATPAPLEPLHDMAEDSFEVAALFDRPSRHELFLGFLDLLSTPGRPIIVVLEDVHWADAATLDLLRFVGRRVARSHALVLATYRSDEIGTAHPLRAVLGALATVPAVTRRTLAPLTVEAVAELAAGTDLDPVDLHRRTGGNPFHVTEVLAHPEAELPETLRDAVLARAARLGDGARRVLDVASLVPGGAERPLLDAVAAPSADDIDACVAAGMLRPTDGGLLEFRHDLARLAVAADVLPARAADLHARIAAALLATPDPRPSRVVHHAAAAGDGDTVLAWAVTAAERAARRGAHQQATEHLARALEHAEGLPAADHADLLERFAASCTRSVGSGRGLTEVERAVALRRDLGDPLRLGNALRIQAVLRYQFGDSPAAYASMDEALAVLEPHGPSPELSDALTEGVTLAMLARRYDDATALGDRAIALAEQLDRPRALAAALDSYGAVELLTDRVEEGVAHVLRSIEVARAAGYDHEVARALGNLGSGAGEVRRYDVAEPYLREAIAYSAERDLDNYGQYAEAWLARVTFETGQWSTAADLLAALPLDDPALPAITRITGLAVLGRLRLRRGDPDATSPLEEAWELATHTGDLQRLWPVAAARAEAALLDGEPERVDELVEQSFALADRLGHPWALGELGLQLWLADALDGHRRAAFDDGAAAPYRLQVAGDPTAAAAAWSAVGCPHEQADALADGDEDQQRRALALLDDLGAAPAAARLRQQMRAAGVRSVPRGPRPATARHPAGLTPREAEVLDLVADGLTNAQIGETLFISEKTAGHHVSSILAKLGVRSRHEAAELVTEH